jgi:choice-of-anchor B domain-containing protein
MKKHLFVLCFLLTVKSIAQISPPINTRLRAMLPKTDFGINSGGNICGYAANGREYALFGHGKGMSIIDVTNPDAPRIIHTIPAVESLWREVKTYKQFAYITTEGIGQGLQIVDMSGLPATINVKSFKGPDGILSSISAVHALHIDTTKGNVYLFGGASYYNDGVDAHGATVLSLNDPWNPKYLGRLAVPYIHDGYVNNDTLFAGHIYGGTFSIIDFKDKANPKILSTTKTPLQFTHNTWISKDEKYIFATDERAGSYLAAYDITNKSEPRLVDKIRSDAKDNAIIHNTHILGNYAVSSWYSEGLFITDVTRPQNMVHVGQYDTFKGSIGDYQGCWGVYPYLPSGNLVVSNIEGEFFIVTPTYKRACYLEGTVIDSFTKQPLSNVVIKIQSTDLDKAAISNLKGEYYTGQVTNGTFQITYTKDGYMPKTVSAGLINGQITLKNVELVVLNRSKITGKITNLPVGKLAKIFITDEKGVLPNYFASTDNMGNFTIDNITGGDYKIGLAAWGLKQYTITTTIKGETSLGNITLTKGYEDSFWIDLGWTIEGDIPAGVSRGRWERGIPIPTFFDGYPANPSLDGDYNKPEKYCFMTGNGGGIGEVDDVDNGTTILVSPLIPKNSNGISLNVIRFNYWYSNYSGTDTFKVVLTDGKREAQLFQTTQSAFWSPKTIALGTTLANGVWGDSLRFKFIVSDLPNAPDIVEGGIDEFSADFSTPTLDINKNWKITAYPNPFNNMVTIDYQLDKTGEKAEIILSNILGQVVFSKKLATTEGSLSINENLAAGVYFIKIQADNGISRAIKVIKRNTDE